MLHRFPLIIMAALALLGSLPASCRRAPDLARHYRDRNVTGSFLLYDVRKAVFIRVNPDRTTRGFLPASTFKIPNSIIALEEGIAPDEHLLLRWDGVQRSYPNWNRDHEMASAFRYSVVWYYQDIARRIGRDRMRAYLAKFRYGNTDLSAPVDSFWLSGPFRVTQEQQVAFLDRLHAENLPVSRRTMAIVKRIMVEESGPGYVIRSKTGLTRQGEIAVGWWVGWVEKGADTFIFANNIESAHPRDSFPPTRIDTAKAIMKDLGIL